MPMPTDPEHYDPNRDETTGEISPELWQEIAEAINYATCTNVRRDWEGEPPELLRADPEESHCPSGTILCDCLVTGKPCLFSEKDPTSLEFRWLPEEHRWVPRN